MRPVRARRAAAFEEEADYGHAVGEKEFVRRRTVLMKAVGKLLYRKTMKRSDLDYLVRLTFRPDPSTWAVSSTGTDVLAPIALSPT